jgi:ribose transport system permease protein
VKKVLGIAGLLVLVIAVTASLEPSFLRPYNLENLTRRTGLFGVLSIGAAFVIITGGIDLSIGSMVGLTGSLLPLLIVEHGWSAALAVPAVLVLACSLGLLHGLLVTKAGLQPFVVTLCGLLFYRGAARWLTDDQTQGFGTGYLGLRSLATGKPIDLGMLTALVGLLLGVWFLLEWRRRRRESVRRRRAAALGAALALGAAVVGLGGALAQAGVTQALNTGLGSALASIGAPAPFLFLLLLTAAAGFFLGETVWGRHLLALGKNVEAARYSGVRTDRLVIGAYVICGLCAGLGGVLFVLDQNSAQPASQGNFYELYAIAAAVLGGCSLRGGEGSILGVVIGTAVVRALYNSINLLGIPTQLEFAIIGAVILAGVMTDEMVQRAVTRRRARRARRASDHPGGTP